MYSDSWIVRGVLVVKCGTRTDGARDTKDGIIYANGRLPNPLTPQPRQPRAPTASVIIHEKLFCLDMSKAAEVCEKKALCIDE